MKIKVGDYIEAPGSVRGAVVKIDKDYVYVSTTNTIYEHLTKSVAIPHQNITYHESFKGFEVLWYEGDYEIHTKEFATRKQALKFYQQHENDSDKFDWMVTKRDINWNIIEDIIY